MPNNDASREKRPLETKNTELSLPYNLHRYRIKHLRIQRNQLNDKDCELRLVDVSPRSDYILRGEKDLIINNGGVTVVSLRDVNTGLLYTGIAVCSLKDQYNKKTGLYIATQRALAGYHRSRQILMPNIDNIKFLKDKSMNTMALLASIPIESFLMSVPIKN